MKKRRDFIKMSGLAGVSFAYLKGLKAFGDNQSVGNRYPSSPQTFNMSGYAAPKLDIVRVGIIGLGNRGPWHTRLMTMIEGVEIRAICDVRPERANLVKQHLQKSGHTPALYTGGKDDWKKLCERSDIDLVILTTPWYMHNEMSIFAMMHGKHVASEVIVGTTVEECWALVETAEKTKRHCMMLENYAYSSFQLLTLNMARKGFFGDVIHADCAYNESKLHNNFTKGFYWDMWWLKQYGSRHGNIYPTHGLGPVSQIMNINRGDRFDYLVSVESNDFMMKQKAEELAKTDGFYKPFTKMDYRGNINTSTIRTVNGRTIVVQHDGTSPRLHTVIHGIYGINGSAIEQPYPAKLSFGLPENWGSIRKYNWLNEEETKELTEKYKPEILRRMGDLARDSGHGGSDLLIDWRLIDCLRNGLPLDQDVYDAAALSAVLPLSAWSVNNRSNSVSIPDFTRGAWKTNLPNMDIELEKGGTTGVKKTEW